LLKIQALMREGMNIRIKQRGGDHEVEKRYKCTWCGPCPAVFCCIETRKRKLELLKA
jgi:hypothetical protein